MNDFFEVWKNVANGLAHASTRNLEQIRKMFGPDLDDTIFSQSMWLKFVNVIQTFMQQVLEETFEFDKIKEFHSACFLVFEISSRHTAPNAKLLATKCVPIILTCLSRALQYSISENKKLNNTNWLLISEVKKYVLAHGSNVGNSMNFIGSSLQYVLYCKHDVKNEFVVKIMSILFAFYKDKHTHKSLIESLLNIIGTGSKVKRKCTKYDIFTDVKVGSPILVIVVLVQWSLSNPDDMAKAYESSFIFAATFLEELSKLCQTNGSDESCYMELLESFTEDLIALSSIVYWPAARLVLQLLTKTLCYSLVADVPYKFRTFVLKQITKLGISLKKHYVIYEGLKEQFHLEDDTDEMEKLLVRFMSEVPQEELTGNILEAHSAMLRAKGRDVFQNVGDDEMIQNVTTEDIGSVAYVMECIRHKNADFQQYVKYAVSSMANKSRFVKSAAARCLEDFINVDPNLLLMTAVGEALNSCLNFATAPGKISICRILGSILSKYPDLTAKYVPHLQQLLNDAAPTVKCAAIAALKLCATNKAMTPLLCFALTLVNNEDEAVRKSVANLFRQLWIEQTDHIQLLILICGKLQFNAHIRQILSILSAGTDPAKNKDVLKCLGSNLVSCLLSNNSKLVIATLIEIISDVAPSALNDDIEALIDVLPLSSANVKELISKTLFNAMKYITAPMGEKLMEISFQQLQIEDVNNPKWTTRTSLLKLLIAIANNPKFISNRLLAPALKKLEDGLSNAEFQAENAKDLRIALCDVLYICKDYAKNEGINRLINQYLTNPKFFLAVLNATCQVHLDYLPAVRNIPLEDHIHRYLQCRTDIPLTEAAIYFVYCTLFGYSKIRQKPEMKELGDTTTETVSSILQRVLPCLMDCTIDPCADIRKSAAPVMKLIVESGLILIPRMLPHILAMTTDVEPVIRNIGEAIATSAASNWDISPFTIEGLRLAFAMKKSVLPPNQIVRGCQNGIATFHIPYKIVREFYVKRRKVVESILNEFLKGEDLPFIVFLADQLLWFPYLYTDELLYLASAIDRMESLNSSNELSLPVRFAIHVAQKVRVALCEAYHITQAKLNNFSPVGAKKEKAALNGKVQDAIDAAILEVIDDNSGMDDLLTQRPLIEDSEEDSENLPLAELQKRRDSNSRKSINRKTDDPNVALSTLPDVVATEELPSESISNANVTSRSRKKRKSLESNRKNERTAEVIVENGEDESHSLVPAAVATKARKKRTSLNSTLPSKRGNESVTKDNEKQNSAANLRIASKAKNAKAAKIAGPDVIEKILRKSAAACDLLNSDSEEDALPLAELRRRSVQMNEPEELAKNGERLEANRKILLDVESRGEIGENAMQVEVDVNVVEGEQLCKAPMKRGRRVKSCSDLGKQQKGGMRDASAQNEITVKARRMSANNLPLKKRWKTKKNTEATSTSGGSDVSNAEWVNNSQQDTKTSPQNLNKSNAVPSRILEVQGTSIEIKGMEVNDDIIQLLGTKRCTVLLNPIQISHMPVEDSGNTPKTSRDSSKLRKVCSTTNAEDADGKTEETRLVALNSRVTMERPNLRFIEESDDEEENEPLSKELNKNENSNSSALVVELDTMDSNPISKESNSFSTKKVKNQLVDPQEPQVSSHEGIVVTHSMGNEESNLNVEERAENQNSEKRRNASQLRYLEEEDILLEEELDRVESSTNKPNNQTGGIQEPIREKMASTLLESNEINESNLNLEEKENQPLLRYVEDSDDDLFLVNESNRDVSSTENKAENQPIDTQEQIAIREKIAATHKNSSEIKESNPSCEEKDENSENRPQLRFIEESDDEDSPVTVNRKVAHSGKRVIHDDSQNDDSPCRKKKKEKKKCVRFNQLLVEIKPFPPYWHTTGDGSFVEKPA